MTRVFVDASVLFAATYSAKGTARDLITLGLERKVTLVISAHVTTEVGRNLLNKYPERLFTFEQLIQITGFEEVDKPTREEVLRAAAYTALKDAPIVAAAIKAHCTYLTTYDHKHLIDPPEVAQKSGLKIVTPSQVIEELALGEE
ncbi:MAG: PIN domain-containing protein [Anaerolineaceae bacterium]|nr:PIN domain-containing protein [Anaerolineaceae bacterium]